MLLLKLKTNSKDFRINVARENLRSWRLSFHLAVQGAIAVTKSIQTCEMK